MDGVYFLPDILDNDNDCSCDLLYLGMEADSKEEK